MGKTEVKNNPFDMNIQPYKHVFFDQVGKIKSIKKELIFIRGDSPDWGNIEIFNNSNLKVFYIPIKLSLNNIEGVTTNILYYINNIENRRISIASALTHDISNIYFNKLSFVLTTFSNRTNLIFIGYRIEIE